MAVKWYRKAANQGLAYAQFNLGVMYYEGRGVPVNNVRSYMWVSKDATENLDVVKKQMTPAQIGEAQALASEWWEKHN